VLQTKATRTVIRATQVRAVELSRDGTQVVIATDDEVIQADVDGTVRWRSHVSSPLGLYLHDNGNVVTARGELDARTGAPTGSSPPDARGVWLRQRGTVEAFRGLVCRVGRVPDTGVDFLDQVSGVSTEGGFARVPVAVDPNCDIIATPPGTGPTTLHGMASFALPDTGERRRGLINLWLVNGESLLARETDGPGWSLFGGSVEGLRCRIGERFVPQRVCEATRSRRLLADTLTRE